MEHAGFSDTLRDRKRQLRHLLLAKQKLGIASGLWPRFLLSLSLILGLIAGRQINHNNASFSDVTGQPTKTAHTHRHTEREASATTGRRRTNEPKQVRAMK